MAKSEQPNTQRKAAASLPDKLAQVGKKNSPELTEEELGKVSGGYQPIDGVNARKN